MSSTTLTALAAHIDEHDLPLHGIRVHDMSVQLTGDSQEDLARWASTLDGVVWRVQDCRQRTDGGEGFWAVYAAGDLDGDVTVWCGMPADLGDTSEAVVAHMIALAAKHADTA
jgi:hypothetical protein